MTVIIKDTEKNKPYRTFDKAETVKENDNCIIVLTKKNKLIFSKPEFELINEEVSNG